MFINEKKALKKFFFLAALHFFFMNREAGPSTAAVQPLEFAKKDQVFSSTLAEDVFDYSIITSNNVSMARDMLANERNWLTWFRLSCTLVILGLTEKKTMK